MSDRTLIGMKVTKSSTMIKGNVHENVFSLIFSHDSKAQEAIIIKKTAKPENIDLASKTNKYWKMTYNMARILNTSFNFTCLK